MATILPHAVEHLLSIFKRIQKIKKFVQMTFTLTVRAWLTVSFAGDIYYFEYKTFYTIIK